MSCPIDVITGFIQLQGPIPQTTLNAKKRDSHPLQLQAGPRTTPPSISGKQINDNASNSCCFTTNTTEKYALIDIQICQLLHKGYILPGMSGDPAAELILSFSGLNNVILLCLPLFTGRSENDAYLTQVIDQPNTTSIITFDSMFVNQPSLGYTTCFELVKQGVVSSSELYAFVFPKGIHLTNSNYQKMMTAIGTLPVYGLSPAIRNNSDTVSASTIVNGSKQILSKSPDGKLPIVQIASCDTVFDNKFMYYIKGPIKSKSSSATTSSSSNGINATKQYKCVPLNKYVKQTTNDIALKDAIGSYDETIKADSTSKIDDPKNILIMESVIAGAIAFTAMAGLAYVIYKILPD